MKIVSLKNGQLSNDYGWTEKDLRKCIKYPKMHPDNDLSEKFEQQRARMLLTLIQWIKANPQEKIKDCRVEYDPNLAKDVLLSKWQGQTYEFYVEG